MAIKLYEHQKTILEQVRPFNRCGIYVDMGGGKTFIGSEKMTELNATVNLLICQKSKVADWVDHFRTYYPDLRVYDATSTKKAEKRAYEYGFWVNYRNGKVFQSVIIINYDLDQVRADYEAVSDELARAQTALDLVNTGVTFTLDEFA